MSSASDFESKKETEITSYSASNPLRESEIEASSSFDERILKVDVLYRWDVQTINTTGRS